MKRTRLVCSVLLIVCSCFVHAQQSASESANIVVPPLVNFSGVLTDNNSKPLAGVVGVTFSLYKDDQGGSPLWIETQNVTPDKYGHYTVQLGASSSGGLSADLFSSGEARWLGVQSQGQAEQPRVMLLSVPYAMKAGDAETVGGLPASAFVMANSATGHSGGNAKAGIETQNYIPMFIDGAGDLGNSILYQLGASDVGIGTTTPSATLEVNGTAKFDGLVGFASSQTFPGTVTGITAGTGINVTGSSSNPTVGINTAFANEYYAQLKAANTFTGNQTVNGTMTATSFSGSGSGLTNVTAANSNELGGLAPSAFAQLATANTFTKNQTVNGTLTATGAVSGGSYQLGNALFAFGSAANVNAFLGFAGSPTTTGSYLTAVGSQALAFNTTGSYNTASGIESLVGNTTGSSNTASGADSLLYNTTGSYNTAIGNYALTGSGETSDTPFANTGVGNHAGGTADDTPLTGTNDTFLGTGTKLSTGSLNNASAIGANAEVGESNAMVLGSIDGVNGQTVTVHVGIGTTVPNANLDVAGNSIETLIGDPGCGTGYAGLGFVVSGGFNSCKNYALLGDGPGNVYLNTSLNGQFFFRNNNGANLMTIDTSGDVNIKGNLSKGGGSFKIDHPLDPANKYLYHSFVESPDMMNVYNGNVITNRRGIATVTLPDYFEALNRDFRYQLTVIGQFAQAIVARKIDNNRFVIRTSKPNVEVSWQVTGIRHDAYADAHRIEVEVQKPPQEQGHYLHPELFGVPPEQAVGYQTPVSPTQGKDAPVSALQALPLTAQGK